MEKGILNYKKNCDPEEELIYGMCLLLAMNRINTLGYFTFVVRTLTQVARPTNGNYSKIILGTFPLPWPCIKQF